MSLYLNLAPSRTVRDHRFFHSYNGVLHGEKAAVDGGNELDTDLDPLLFLSASMREALRHILWTSWQGPSPGRERRRYCS
jgi:hypothetical protein